MNMKITMICFILLLFFLIGVVSAESDNETLKLNEMDLKKLEASKNTTVLTKKTVNKLTQNKVKIKVSALEIYYGDLPKLKITLKDAKNNAVKNSKVKVMLNNKFTTLKTDSKGIAKYSPNLNVGTHKVFIYFDGTSKYSPASASSSITVKSTVKAGELSKYYVKNSNFQSSFLNKDGKALKNSNVKFKVNDKTFTVKTNSRGVAKLSYNFLPGFYTISAVNPKSLESFSKTFHVRNVIESADIVVNESDKTSYSVKILDKNGKASPNRQVTFKISNISYTSKTNNNGIAKITINLKSGNYSVVSEYEGIKNINKITVNNVLKKQISNYTHRVFIHDYVNVTLPYAFHYNDYTLSPGVYGVVKMPKIELFTVKVNSVEYKFKTGPCDVWDCFSMEYKSYFIPFNGYLTYVISDKNYIAEDGLILTRNGDGVEIECRNTLTNSSELFGVFSEVNDFKKETLTYMKNNQVIAEVSIETKYYDEAGVIYSLSRLYDKQISNFDYIDNKTNSYLPVLFTNNLQPVIYSETGKHIIGFPSKEVIETKFFINDKLKFEKEEEFSYGLNSKYKFNYPFEIMQCFSIINEEVNYDNFTDWINQSSLYDYSQKASLLYAMHLAALKTAIINSEINQNQNLCIFTGINLDESSVNVIDINSSALSLAYIAQNSLLDIIGKYTQGAQNLLDNLLDALKNNQVNISKNAECVNFTSDKLNLSLNLADLKYISQNNEVSLPSDSNCFLVKFTLPFTLDYFKNEFDLKSEIEELKKDYNASISSLIEYIDSCT